MDYRTVVKSLVLLAAVCLGAAACNNENSVPKHTAAEDKAIERTRAMTPEQRIDMIQKGPMPPSAKEAMIRKIKEKNGLK